MTNYESVFLVAGLLPLTMDPTRIMEDGGSESACALTSGSQDLTVTLEIVAAGTFTLPGKLLLCEPLQFCCS